MNGKARAFLAAVALFLWWAGTCISGPIEDCEEYSRLGVPGNQGDILCRTGYLLAHSQETKTPYWVIEHLTAEKAKGKLKRKDNFEPDPDLEKGKRAELTDYKGSGYTRGHMAPAADMKWNTGAMEQCFYLSNMIPQNPPMNEQIWAALEENVRAWAIRRDDVYVVTGPIYKGGVKKTIGKNRVGVPTHIYKIVYDPNTLEAIAFIMPNKPIDKKGMAKYIVTIRDVEAKTGLDFLSGLNTQLQDIVETKKQTGLWRK